MERVGRMLFVTMGVGFLALAAICAIHTRRFIRTAATAEGVVVELLSMGTRQEVVFTTASGERVDFYQSGMVFGLKPGDKVRVLYTPGNAASSASIDAFGGLWFVPLFFLFMGAGFIYGGIWGGIRLGR